MGQELSTEAKFVTDIQSELKARRVEVSKKDLCSFFALLHEVCPWFTITAPHIANSTWCQVGDELETFYKHDEPHRNFVMQYWQLLQGIIVNSPFSPTSKAVLSQAQQALDSASRGHSRATSRSSSFIDLSVPPHLLPEPVPPALADLDPLSSRPKPLASRPTSPTEHPPPKQLYPSLAAVQASAPPYEDSLSPEDEAFLEAFLDEQAAAYHPQPPPLPTPLLLLLNFISPFKNSLILSSA